MLLLLLLLPNRLLLLVNSPLRFQPLLLLLDLLLLLLLLLFLMLTHVVHSMVPKRLLQQIICHRLTQSFLRCISTALLLLHLSLHSGCRCSCGSLLLTDSAGHGQARLLHSDVDKRVEGFVSTRGLGLLLLLLRGKVGRLLSVVRLWWGRRVTGRGGRSRMALNYTLPLLLLLNNLPLLHLPLPFPLLLNLPLPLHLLYTLLRHHYPATALLLSIPSITLLNLHLLLLLLLLFTLLRCASAH